MRFLTLRIREPLPGNVLPEMSAEHGPEEAARRYRAITLTTFRQLRGLKATTLRIVPDPDDAAEAIRFWLLPKLADRWQNNDPSFQTDGWNITFAAARHPGSVHAEADVLCPFLSARWIHTALIGIERGTHRVSGPADDGGECFKAEPPAPGPSLETRRLPSLPVIRTHADWERALQTPLGPSLKKAWKEEA